MHHSTNEINHYICVLSITVNTKKCFFKNFKKDILWKFMIMFSKSQETLDQ